MTARLTNEERMLRAVQESAVQQTLTEAFDTLQYRWHHETDSRRTTGGFPDLFAIHERSGWLVICEVKTEVGTYRPGQKEWLRIAGFEPDDDAVMLVDYTTKRLVGVCRPSSLDDWLDELKRAALR